MKLQRPDLSAVSPEVREYIEALEAQVSHGSAPRTRAVSPSVEPTEPPTTVNLIAVTAATTAKRTPRHLYGRQKRGGMGIFDIDTSDDAPPSLLCLADASATLIAISDQGRAYRGHVADISESAIRAKGSLLDDVFPLRNGERIAALLPAAAGDHLAILSEKGWINTQRASFLGRSMIQGIRVMDCEKHGAVTGAAWYHEGSDILIATHNGMGIRFPSARIRRTGCLGIRLEKEDRAVATCEVACDASTVFVLSHNGKGTLRSMEGFRSNKSPGGAGKVLLKTHQLVGVVPANWDDDIFIISATSKLIRFNAGDIPVKTGVVQGVNCMALRNDTCTALTVT